MAFDAIVTKKISEELTSLIDYKIDKIYQPDKNTLVLGLYGNFTNVALLTCISSNNEDGVLTIGQVNGILHDILPVQEIMDRMMAECFACLDRYAQKP